MIRCSSSSEMFAASLTLTTTMILAVLALVLCASSSISAARHVGVWVHPDQRISHAHTDKAFDRHHRGPAHHKHDAEHPEHRPQALQHPSAKDAFDAEFSMVANTKSGHSVLLHASHNELGHQVMHYDGAPASHGARNTNPLPHGAVMEGGVGPAHGVPRDATHHVRAHVPDDTVGVRVLHRGKPHGMELPASVEFFQSRKSSQQTFTDTSSSSSSSSRTADQLAARNLSNIERKTLQSVNLLTNPTLVILSSGYQATERATFFADADRVTSLLSGGFSGFNADGVDPGPWGRYFSLFNVYAVFEGSAESGASFRKGEGHVCPDESDGTCAAKTVKDNLNCSFGSPYPRVLSCEYQEVLELAAMAPRSEVILVIVNEKNYGGSGGAGIAVVSRSSDMELAIVHMLNHAVAGLGDEYDYGQEGTPIKAIPNCRDSASAATVWRTWMAAGSADTSPSSGCGYSNLVRPTADSCLMRKKTAKMCSVCAEALAQGIYNLMNTSNRVTAALGSSAAGAISPLTSPTPQGTMDLAAPRCPPFGYRAHLTDADNTQLYINHNFLSQSNATVLWVLPTGSRLSTLTKLEVLGSSLPAGRNEITVSVTDSASYVSNDAPGALATHQQMAQSFKFELYKETAATGCSSYTCTSSRGETQTYCLSCTLGAGCTGNTQTRLLPASAERPVVTLDDDSQTNMSIALAVVICVGVAILLIGLIATLVFRIKYVQEIMIIKGGDCCLAFVTVFFLLGVFGLTVVTVYYGVISLPRLPVFGEPYALASLIVAAALCVLSAILIVAAYARSSIALVIPGAIITAVSVPLVAVSLLALWIAANPLSATVRDWTKSEWKNKVTEDPGTLCQVQNYFECSGYEQTCGINAASEWCAERCTYSNTYTDPCATRMNTFLESDLWWAALFAFIASFVVLTAGICALVLSSRYRAIIANGRHRRSYRHERKQPVEWLTAEELEHVREEWLKVASTSGGDGGGDDGDVNRSGSNAPGPRRAALTEEDAGAMVVHEEDPDHSAYNNNSGSRSRSRSRGLYASPGRSAVPTATANAAIDFVSDVMGERIDQRDANAIHESATTEGNHVERVTLNRVMHIIFPYLDFGNPFHDPRTLTEDEAASRANAAELMLAHQDKHEAYIDAAGALSPAKLKELYMKHCMTKEGTYKAHPQFFSIVRSESARYGATAEGQMCRGLVPAELDGLRTLWARLNPAIEGDLSDGAIATLFAITHQGTRIRTQEHFARWKATLDVQQRDGVGWAEFCLPFAARALHEEARKFMVVRTQGDLDVLSDEYGNLDRLMSKREVRAEFGDPYVQYVFLPHEEAVPLIRVLAAVVRSDVDAQVMTGRGGGGAAVDDDAPLAITSAPGPRREDTPPRHE